MLPVKYLNVTMFLIENIFKIPVLISSNILETVSSSVREAFLFREQLRISES